MIPGSEWWRRNLGSRETWLAVLLFTALTVVFAYPLSVHPATLRFDSGPDGEIGWYLLAWNTHALFHHPWSIFEANFYYPEHLTLAFGENVIGLAPFAAPVIWFTRNPLLAANVVAMLSCVLCGLGAYVLARRIGVSVAAALVAGIVFECAPPRFFRISQINLSAVQWIPFALAALHAYLQHGRKRDLRLAAACVTLQALTSGHGAVFMAVALGAFAAYRLGLGEPLHFLRRVRDLGVSGALILLPTFLVFLPYRAVQREVGLRRGLGSWDYNYAAFLASPSRVHQFLLSAFGCEWVNETASAFLFPGYLTLLLSAAAVAWRSRATLPEREPSPAVPSLPHTQPAAFAVRRAHTPSRSPGPPRTSPASTGARASATGSAGVILASPARASVGTAWLRLAHVLSVGASAFALMAGAHSLYGRPVRLYLDDRLVFAARGPSRTWMFAAALLACRLMLLHGAPLGLWNWVRVLWTWIARGANAVSKTLRRAQEFLRSSLPSWRRSAAAWASFRRQDATTFYLVLTALTFGLALGPPYGLWRFVYWMPGFAFIRANARFGIVGMLGLAILAAIGFDRVARRFEGGRRRVLATAVCALLVMEFAPMPMPIVAAGDIRIPAVDGWLDTQPKPFVVAEVPMLHPKHGGRSERLQTRYMLHSTAHWQKTVHGYSGWRTDLHHDLFVAMENFPDEQSLALLTGLGVHYVVAHTDLYAPGRWSQVEGLIEKYPSWLRLEHVEGAGRVYSLHKPAGRPPR